MALVTEILLSDAAKFAIDRVRQLLPSNTRRLDEQWREILEELLFEIQQAVRDLEAAGKVIVVPNEREICALLRRVGTEATHATTKERVRLLGCAFAGLLTPDFDAEIRSRVSRAVVQLEPSDVIRLRELLATASLGANKIEEPLPPANPIYEGLLAAGCTADANVWGGGVYVTQLGRAVAKCLEQWRPAVDPPAASST